MRLRPFFHGGVEPDKCTISILIKGIHGFANAPRRAQQLSSALAFLAKLEVGEGPHANPNTLCKAVDKPSNRHHEVVTPQPQYIDLKP